MNEPYSSILKLVASITIILIIVFTLWVATKVYFKEELFDKTDKN